MHYGWASGLCNPDWYLVDFVESPGRECREVTGMRLPIQSATRYAPSGRAWGDWELAVNFTKHANAFKNIGRKTLFDLVLFLTDRMIGFHSVVYIVTL